MIARADFDANAGRLVQRGTGQFSPLDAQFRLAESLVERRRVVTMLPTGVGKTFGATLPFAMGLLDPAQMVFMTPLRTLSDAQAATLSHELRQEVAEQFLQLAPGAWRVSQQTGTTPGDPLFESPAVVTTFDQAISSALRIGYSLSKGRRTVNAGAVLSSYLVADELHLFPRDEALTSLICLLNQRPPELPFLLMTATLTPTIARGLAEALNAELVDATALTDSDRRRLGVEQRVRHVHWQTMPFTADQIATKAREQSGRRTLVVVNTVNRAIDLARELAADPRIGQQQVRVLHSRFYQAHRAAHEAAIRGAFGKDHDGDWQGEIVVATQVVEVGLDISADLLFTEIAPANALVQRWGRCARWGGSGKVIVAPPPGDGKVYPYVGEQGGMEIVARTRAWLEERASQPAGLKMDDEAEQALLGAAHEAADAQWLNALELLLPKRATDIGETLAEGLYERAGQLIRHVDTRTVLIFGDPTAQTLPEPQRMQGFSLSPRTLMSLLPDERRRPGEEDVADDDGESMFTFTESSEPTWRLKRPRWSADAEQSERRANMVIGWEDIEKRAELLAEPLLALNPELVSYDPFFGLSLKRGEQPVDRRYWASPVQRSGPPQANWGPRQRETLEHHVGTMLALYQRHPTLGPRLRRVAASVEVWCGWPAGMLDRLTRAAIVAHDAGKLSPDWQRGIVAFQQAINQPKEDWLVHTDDPGAQEPPWKVPHHALSGAAYSLAVGEALDAEVVMSQQKARKASLPSRVLFTAIATHHTPTLKDAFTLTDPERLDSAGLGELNRLLEVYGVTGRVNSAIPENLTDRRVKQANLSNAASVRECYALALVTRMLRLSDGWSQEPERVEVALGVKTDAAGQG